MKKTILTIIGVAVALIAAFYLLLLIRAWI